MGENNIEKKAFPQMKKWDSMKTTSGAKELWNTRKQVSKAANEMNMRAHQNSKIVIVHYVNDGFT